MKPRPPIPAGPYLVVGLARSGLAAARTLRACGERVVGVDAAEPAGAHALAAEGVELHLGGDGVAQLEGAGAVVKSPGVPAQAPAVAAARAAGVPVIGELELAWRLLPNDFIAVTGTNGKTTTVHWIDHIHREAGLPVALAGNVGDALSGLVGRIEADVSVVCEASSFQLEDTLAFAPEAAALLNLSADHLDRHGTMAAYREAKLRIFANQEEGDVAVLGPGLDDVPTAAGVRRVRCECALRDAQLWWEGQPLVAVDELRLRGAHNLQNAVAAAAVCLARGLDRDAVRAGLRSFAGVAHRLQEVARRGGVLYVNDSKATNVASTLVALAAFSEGRVHLILGGQGKDQDFAALRGAVSATARAVYLIGEDAPAIARALENLEIPVCDCGELEQAVAAASAAAQSGEVVLLSPACASFDQFTDYEARGEQFVALVSAATHTGPGAM